MHELEEAVDAIEGAEMSEMRDDLAESSQRLFS